MTKKKQTPDGNGNLKPPWKKGQSGNPKGRINGSKNRTTVLRQMGDAILKGVSDPFGVIDGEMTLEEAMAVRAYQRALGLLKGVKHSDQHKAWVEIMDTMYGKKPEVIAGDPDNPIETGVTVRFID